MKSISTIVLLLAQALLFAQKGDKFPALKGTTLDDKSITVPVVNGKYSVIAIAFSRSAEDDLKKWLNPLYDAFIPTETVSTTGFDMAEIYDVNFMFIPMIAGFRRVAEEFKKGTDKQFWAYIMDTEKTDINALQGKLRIGDNKIPYFYVLDKEGKIVDVQSGKFSEAKLDKLEEAVN
jgi:hypothetical protein